MSSPEHLRLRQELTQADQHIARAEGGIVQQLQRIAHLEGNSLDAQDARTMLRVMRLGLTLAQERRRQITAKLADK